MFNISELEILTISHKYNLNITKQNETRTKAEKSTIYISCIWYGYITKQSDMLSSYDMLAG